MNNQYDIKIGELYQFTGNYHKPIWKNIESDDDDLNTFIKPNEIFLIINVSTNKQIKHRIVLTILYNNIVGQILTFDFENEIILIK